jgi:transposase
VSEVTTLGIDLAKNVFSLHGVDEGGAVVLRKSVARSKLLQAVAQLRPCLIGMEACSGAHEWARRFAQLGHTVKLMAAQFVAAYRKSGKNDGNDAEAICEAVSRPSMRFVPVKTREQQVQLSVHRVRSGYVEERTAMLNRVRGLLAEFGEVLPLGSTALMREVSGVLERLPVRVGQVLRDLLEHVRMLESRIRHYDRAIQRQADEDERAVRLRELAGIGPLSATAILATGNVEVFKNGRQFAAWLGLVPRQHSSGGKARLGSITRSGDGYVRTLLVLGARAVLREAPRRTDPLSRWAVALRARRGYHRACVAIAAKNARRIWAVLAGRRPREAALPQLI